ncbi:hypothetical protein ABTK00_20880, partial [Acinetobacter baumannii]
MIVELAKLQNPIWSELEEKEKFNKINQFLRIVTDCDNATIEVPHNRDTIHVDIDGKVLRLESLGT